mmetsp:Transcript_106969/g.309415  ORF Transcript_106969/g.309415 Transcript_106969/m.309415 type:complete len:207 (-) Transcript_106969:670-1290(-)
MRGRRRDRFTSDGRGAGRRCPRAEDLALRWVVDLQGHEQALEVHKHILLGHDKPPEVEVMQNGKCPHHLPHGRIVQGDPSALLRGDDDNVPVLVLLPPHPCRVPLVDSHSEHPTHRRRLEVREALQPHRSSVGLSPEHLSVTLALGVAGGQDHSEDLREWHWRVWPGTTRVIRDVPRWHTFPQQLVIVCHGAVVVLLEEKHGALEA